MKLGLSLPTAGTTASTEAITEVAEGAERLGLDSVWAFERLLAPTGDVRLGEHTFPMPEVYRTVYSPLEVLAFAAARTSRVRLGTSIVLALLHNPVSLARSLATLDQLSNGRVVAGLGQGWLEAEFEAAGTPLRRRGAGFVEFIDVMRAVWGPDPVSFDGRFYQVAESRVNPKPVQPGGPPLLAAAEVPASIRRTAQLGLGFNPVWQSWEALEGTVTAFRDAAREAGRDPDELPVVLRVNQPFTDTPTGDEASPAGSPEQVAEALPRLERLGVTEVFWGMEFQAEEQLQLMGRLLKLIGRDG